MRIYILILFVCLSMCVGAPGVAAQKGYLSGAAHSVSTVSPVSTARASFRSVPPQLKPVVAKLLALPEANELLTKVSREGTVGIVMQGDASAQFDAVWDGDARVIKINPHRHRNDGSLICSILFELHNASTNKRMLYLFSRAERNQMTKEAWVENMERMEHDNALKTCRLLEKGISEGVYPIEARWPIFHVFEDHYKLQQVTGHSIWLANLYDQVNAYSAREAFRGTIPGLQHLTSADKKDLNNYLSIKNSLASSSKKEVEKGQASLRSEHAHLEECLHGKKRTGCVRTQERLRLLRAVFGSKGEYAFTR